MRWLKYGALGLALSACGGESDGGSSAEKAPVQPSFGDKADGTFGAQRVGALALGGGAQVALDDTPLAWRFIVFPGTKVRIEARSPDRDIDPVLSVLGPIPGDESTVAAFNDDAPSGDTFDSVVEISADRFGAYEVVVGSYGIYSQGKATPGRIAVSVDCSGQCTQPQMTLDALLDAVPQDQLLTLLEVGVPALFPHPETAEAVKAQAVAYFGDREGYFPSVPMSALGTAQALLESPSETLPAPEPVTFDLVELLTKNCAPARSELTPLHPSLPAELTRGWLPDWRIDDCTLQRGQDLANVLNNLALENGSKVVADGVSYESVEDVFAALIDGGHHVRVENARYLANFLGLNFQGVTVAAPVWLDTGIPAGDGTVQIPAPHTHHTIFIEGPLVNSKLMYYMGTSGGTSFRVDSTLRPDWVGEKVTYTYDSVADRDAIIELMVVAARLRKVWHERGQGLPVSGYGKLGVCNDSTAVLEYAAEETVTIFPLAHPPVEDASDVVDQILSKLPSDTAGFEPGDAIRRIAETMPYTDGLLQPVTDALSKASSR